MIATEKSTIENSTHKGIASFESERGNTLEINFIEVAATALTFNVQFKRPDDYRGEFGFDWMRDSYKPTTEKGGEGVSLQYEALKQEYKPTTAIDDKAYFIPWLSMLPNQKKVTLDLEYETEGEVKEGNKIKIISEQKGIKIKVLEGATETITSGEETVYEPKVADLPEKI